MSVNSLSSSTSEISPVVDTTTQTIEVEIATTDDQLASPDTSTAKCCPLPFRIKRSIREPAVPNGIDTATASTTAATTATNNNSREQALQLLHRISKDLDYVKNASEDVRDYKKLVMEYENRAKEYENHVTTQIEEASTMLKSLQNRFNYSIQADDVQKELRELKQSVMKMKLQILSDASKNRWWSNDTTHGKRLNDNKKQKQALNLCMHEKFEHSSAFKDLKALYDGLGKKQKDCLLSFSVFPENEIINKRFMLYWWIGEGFVGPTPGSERTTEDLANEVFDEFMDKGLIEPVNIKRNLEVNRCKMHPSVRAAVVMIAERAKIFDFDSEGKPTPDFTFSHRACLFEGESVVLSGDMDKLHTLFNVDETTLQFEDPALFSKMKNINVLCLGRWQTSPTHHIEVEDTKFLDGLKSMKHLKFLSLQGISRIMELPSSISNLANLTILDLRACHNLEEISNEIGSLKNLTHLDMSECYLLDNMPKELSSLLKLQVLKGFIVGNSKGKNSCTLQHLANLTKLRKLSIHTVRDDFPAKTELRVLHKFNMLRSLTIVWGRGSINDTSNAADSPATTKRSICFRFPKMRKDTDALDFVPPQLPTQLEKLDLQCFPQTCAPSWLEASKLRNIKKLYIRGGTLRDLGQFQEEKFKWEAEILVLKYLRDLEMDWRELQELFPKLNYLEKVECPKLRLFPCDSDGVWMK